MDVLDIFFLKENTNVFFIVLFFETKKKKKLPSKAKMANYGYSLGGSTAVFFFRGASRTTFSLAAAQPSFRDDSGFRNTPVYPASKLAALRPTIFLCRCAVVFLTRNKLLQAP